MPTSPSSIRAAQADLTEAANADVAAVAALGRTPKETRALLFEAVPLVVADYANGSASLAVDWYDEIRQAASSLRRGFTPVPVTTFTPADLAGMVAVTTEPLHGLIKHGWTEAPEALALLRQATEQSMTDLLPRVQYQVASGFRDTMTTNVKRDKAAAGWKRFAQPDACKFCTLLAARGAVYTEATSRFAAHTSCHCIAGPAFGKVDTEASPMQYKASAKRSDDPKVQAERNAKLRDYLNEHYPDARG